MIIYFYKLNTSKDQQRPIEFYIKYFDYLSNVLENFNNKHNKDLNRLYNQYGQEIPLIYRVQKTGLDVYYNDETKSENLKESSI